MHINNCDNRRILCSNEESESKGDTTLTSSTSEKRFCWKRETVWGSEVLANMSASANDLFPSDGIILHRQNCIQGSGGM